MTFEKPFPLQLSPSPTTKSTASTTTTLRSVSFSSCASSVSPSVPLTRGGYRRQPVILRDASPAKLSARFGEIAGGTAAECAAICCCWPCGLLDLIVTAVVKLPAGLARRAYKKRRRRRRMAAMRKAALLGSYGSSGGGDDESVRMKEEWGIPVAEPTPELVAMEKEMWCTFYGTGFWRSLSQREKEDR